MNILINLSIFIVIIISGISSFYVLIKRKSAPYSTYVFLTLIGVVLWATSNYLFQITTNLDEAFLYNKIANVSAILIAIGVLFFSQTFLIKKNTSLANKLFVGICFFLSILFFILALFTEYLDAGVIYDEYNNKKIVTSFFKTPFHVFIMVCLAYGIYSLYQSYKQTQGISKLQIGVFTSNLLISTIGGVIFSVTLPSIQDYRFVLIGPALAIFGSFGYVYLLLNYRYADFRIIFAEFLEKFILTSIVVVFIITTNYLIRQQPQDKYVSTEIIVYSISTFLFLIFLKFAFQNGYFQRFLPIPNFKQQLERLKNIVLRVNSVIDLIDLYKSIVIPTLGIKNCTIILTHHAEYKKHKETFTKIFEYQDSNVFIFDEEYRKYMDGVTTNIQVLRFFQILKNSFDVNCLIQLKYLNQVIGYVLLGVQKKISYLLTMKYDFSRKLVKYLQYIYINLTYMKI